MVKSLEYFEGPCNWMMELITGAAADVPGAAANGVVPGAAANGVVPGVAANGVVPGAVNQTRY